MLSWIGLDLALRAGQALKHPLYVARIGPVTIVGLAGEPFGGISVRLQQETLGENLIVCETGNGYLSYILTAAKYPLGGYEPSATPLDVSAEDNLVGRSAPRSKQKVGYPRERGKGRAAPLRSAAAFRKALHRPCGLDECARKHGPRGHRSRSASEAQKGYRFALMSTATR